MEKKTMKSTVDICKCGHKEEQHWGNALGHCKACSCWGFRPITYKSVIEDLEELAGYDKLG